MTLYAFNSLSTDEQYNFLWQEGVYLDTVVKKDIKLNLYAINKFFVEVHYNAVTNKLVALKSFKYGTIMDKYIS
ncbi:hypothetical protein [Winogradskyella forsetii]|uniref:hypothetical protein n=1 Tax=Winogradskyella forsetii TaxID=2686077 RepID=UPI0015BBA7D7|nr:hypothetical protein [Winogradskyella forsetii]